jgi:predicted kinase
MKELFLLRGLPGAGKSTLAKSIGGRHAEADQYFMEDDEYKFDASKLEDAHLWCQNIADAYMRNEIEKVIVSNTFTQEWEMQPYYDLAKKYGYRVHSIIVENRHGGINQHGVPTEKIEQMRNRFIFKL